MQCQRGWYKAHRRGFMTREKVYGKCYNVKTTFLPALLPNLQTKGLKKRIELIS